MHCKNALAVVVITAVFGFIGSAHAETLLWVHHDDVADRYVISDEAKITFDFDPPQLVIWQGDQETAFDLSQITKLEFDPGPENSVKDQEQQNSIIRTFNLLNNHPNPFNPTTTINYELNTPGLVNIVIYDAMGKEIRSLLAEQLLAGSHQAQWDGRDNGGLKAAAGTYFYQLTVDGAAQTKKMVLIK